MRSRGVSTLLVVLTLAAAACGGGDAASTEVALARGGSTTATEPGPERLRLGYLLPETGPEAALGRPLIAAVEMAVAEINAAGGVLGAPVELRAADETGDVGRAIEETSRLLAAGVDAVIGPASIGIGTVVVAQVTGAGVVQCAPSDTGLRPPGPPSDGLYFRSVPSELLQVPVLLELVTSAGLASIAVVTDADDRHEAFVEAVARTAEARGLEVVQAVSHESGAADPERTAETLAESGAEAIVLLTSGEGSSIIAGLLAAGVEAYRLFASDGITREGLEGSLPSLAPLEGMRVTSRTPAVADDFEARLLAFNPSLVDLGHAPSAYDCVNLIALAAAIAGSSSPGAIRDHLIRVTRGENACATFAECMEHLAVGGSIAYRSAAGTDLALVEDDEGGATPSVGTVQVNVWRRGVLTSVRRVTGQLAR